jgi:hypothetical protein
VAGGLTFARSWRARRQGGPRGARLTLILRGTLVVLGCAAAALVDALVRALVVGHAWGADGSIALVVLSFGTMATGATLMRSRRRARAVPSTPTASDDDIETLYRVLAGCLPWLDPRRHPWRFAAIVATGAGVAIAGAHGLSEGGFSVHHVAREMYAAAILVGTEAFAALIGFALLGRYLGLRSDRGAPSTGPG